MGTSRSRLAVLVAVASLVSVPALADEDIELGGRWSMTGSIGAGTVRPNTGTTNTGVAFGFGGAYTTPGGRHEIGMSLMGVGAVDVPISENNFITLDTPLLLPVATYRMNTDLWGPGKRMLAYGGIVVGANLQPERDGHTAVFGPKFGFEYYLSRMIALQVEDQIQFNTNGNGIQNLFVFGGKFIFR